MPRIPRAWEFHRATDDCIKTKQEALKEVIHYIHKAGLDIEVARTEDGPAMKAMVEITSPPRRTGSSGCRQRTSPEHDEHLIMGRNITRSPPRR